MPKKNKNTCVRRGKCQCSQIDNQTVSSVQESTKSVVRDSGYNLQEASTKDSTLTKETMIMPLMKGLCSLKDAIIENEHIETKHVEPCNENHEKKDEWKQINQKLTKQKMRNNNSNGRPLRRLQNVEKDSHSTRNQSSNANNVTAINMPLNYKNIDSCISYTALEKPMDISTEKYSFNKTQFPINISQDTESFADEQSNVIRNKFLKSYTQKQCNNSSANKEIARIFRQRFTSPDNMHSSSSFPKSFSSYKCEESKQSNFFYNIGNSKFSSDSLIRPRFKKNETEQKKELSIKYSPTNEKEKFTFDKEKNKKHTEQRNKKEAQEKKRSFQQHGPTKCKSHYSRIPVGNKESKQNNLKYKETGTQTDTVFPTDHDVEMVSVGTKRPEQQFYRCSTHKSQDRDTNQELNYVADNEKPENKLLTITYQQISLYSTSSSSTDLSFDGQTSTSPDTDIAMELWSTKLFNSINTFGTPTRAPPGFPEVPQNPPLLPYIYNPEHLMPPSLKDDYDPDSHIKPVTAVPPAPPPMRHLYYDYPEFMELPAYSNSSNVLY